MASSGRVDVGTCKIRWLCEEPLPRVPGMVDPSAHYRCPEVCGRLFAVWEPDGAYKTVDTNVGAYNTVCVRAVEEHCSRRRTGYGPGIVV